MMTSLTNDLTTVVNAAPTVKPIARSTMLPQSEFLEFVNEAHGCLPILYFRIINKIVARWSTAISYSIKSGGDARWPRYHHSPRGQSLNILSRYYHTSSAATRNPKSRRLAAPATSSLQHGRLATKLVRYRSSQILRTSPCIDAAAVVEFLVIVGVTLLGTGYASLDHRNENFSSKYGIAVMQVLTTACPYCKQQVDSTLDHLDGPVVCPHCHKPFEMEMPTAVVTAVAEVDGKSANRRRMAQEPGERTLAKVHPVVFRARPIATLVISIVGLAAATVLILGLLGMTVAGVAFDETMMVGPASLLTWVCAIILLAVACVVGYWILLSKFTTLTITDDRTIYREGLISRDTSEVQHDDVRNIQLDQSFGQRLLGVGGIVVRALAKTIWKLSRTRPTQNESSN